MGYNLVYKRQWLDIEKTSKLILNDGLYSKEVLLSISWSISESDYLKMLLPATDNT